MADLQPEVKYADINSSQIEYLDYDGDGPVIIMLHATGFLPWLWHPIAKRLAHSSRTIAPYFCDHRQEEPESGGVSWLTLAEDLCKLCKALEIEKPLLVGHSMGATVITIAGAITSRTSFMSQANSSFSILNTTSWVSPSFAISAIRTPPFNSV